MFYTRKNLLRMLEEEKKNNRRYLQSLMDEQEKNNELIKEVSHLKSHISILDISIEDMAKKNRKLLDERRRIDNLRLKAIAEKNELRDRLAALEDDVK